MIYKTLIIFDTNKVRHTDYVDFKLGGDYEIVKKFIKDNNLEQWIKISIPEYVIEEVKKQKIEEYRKDSDKFLKISKKFQNLGIITNQVVDEFNIKKHFEKRLSDYIIEQNLQILRLDKTKYESIFEKIIERALDKKLPFKNNSKHSDTGFKDVLIWETILNNKSKISWHDSIYYCSGDNGFADCKNEFEKVYNKNFELFSSGDLLIEKLLNQYSDIIENYQIFSLIKTPYFVDQIKEYFESVGVWEDIDDDECDIIDVDVQDRCINFEKVEGEGDEELGDVFKIESYVMLELEKEKDGKSISFDTDVYITTSIDENNNFIDFEIN